MRALLLFVTCYLVLLDLLRDGEEAAIPRAAITVLFFVLMATGWALPTLGVCRPPAPDPADE